LLIARKHMGWTCQGFAGAAQLRQHLMRAATEAEALELLDQASAGFGGRFRPPSPTNGPDLVGVGREHW
jgi:hypothetical protein